MRRPLENIYPDLKRLENEIEELLFDQNLSPEKSNFYTALKTIISLKMDTEEVQYKFSRINEVLTAIAIGDFSQRIELLNRKNIFSYLGSSLNAVTEELKVNVVKTQYLEASIEFIPHLALITDKEGIILFANTVTFTTLGKSPKEILQLQIANIFENKTQFGIHNPDFNCFKDIEVNIKFCNTALRTQLTIKVINNKLGQLDGYLYIAKQI